MRSCRPNRSSSSGTDRKEPNDGVADVLEVVVDSLDPLPECAIQLELMLNAAKYFDDADDDGNNRRHRGEEEVVALPAPRREADHEYAQNIMTPSIVSIKLIPAANSAGRSRAHAVGV
eukprot:CAMPEP_0205891826 /NCGR_PEP_ID=MMETSP1083-20121108/22314_1 /ASSEMBLY_ACC=CAM_ASM_000430 /TAXON_ID=97485 /ORGANISM="Prymnesium parvum, Strain Texoma1" /LENGTH=117 /DNA_ID=CAMNT_0053256231 /DNA_START=152 /DNA_END=506 /DNA_ORIENTATION=+